MSREQLDTANMEVQMMMVVKLHQLQRENLATLTYGNLEDYLEKSLWRTRYPESLHVAANDILQIQASDIVRFLSRQAITKGSQASLADFSDLIGGE